MNPRFTAWRVLVFAGVCLVWGTASAEPRNNHINRIELPSGSVYEDVTVTQVGVDRIGVIFKRGQKVMATANFGGGKIIGRYAVTPAASALLEKESHGKGYFESTLLLEYLPVELQRRFNYDRERVALLHRQVLSLQQAEEVEQLQAKAVGRYSDLKLEKGDTEGKRLLIEGSIKEAVAWYRKAAENENPRAQAVLGIMYALGDTIPKDADEAAKWCRKSADHGFPAGETALGFLFYWGEGVEKNDQEAVEWFRKGSMQGYAKAQVNLANMYERGEGVAKDIPEAYAWLNVAARSGDKGIVAHRDRVGKQLAKSVLLAAQLRSRELTRLIDEER